LLQDLLELYCRGLRAPLPFFPKAALAFAEAQLNQSQTSGRGKSPLEKARMQWDGPEYPPGCGEKENAYFKLCFRNQDPLAGEFAVLATRVFAPILQLAHREDA